MKKDYGRYLRKDEHKALKSFIKGVKSLLGNNLVSIELFGSKARGGFDEESDLDVLIVLCGRDWATSHRISIIATEINLEYDCNISPVIYTQAEYQKNQQFNTLFIQNLKKEAIAL
ncbi:nucleotidyltransferase domain-containing protein [bacterium]|nr:nucleotidyltransferase domain-containing protein [bacterium]